MFYEATTSREILEKDWGWRLKFHFWILSYILSPVAILSLGLATQSYRSKTTAPWNGEGEDISLSNIYTLAILSWSVTWNIVEYFVVYARQRPVNPGASVVVELVTWILLASSLAYLVGNAVGFYNTWGPRSDVGPKGWEWAGMVVSLMVCVVQLLVFVCTCRNCHVRRQDKRKEKKSVGIETKLDLESVDELPVLTKQADSDPVVIASVHCQRNVCHHRSSDDELVPGAPTNRSPRYSATIKQPPPGIAVGSDPK